MWANGKPDKSDVLPYRALDVLAIIEKKIVNTKDEWIRICKAKELLEMELGDPKRLDPLEDQLKLMKQSWEFLKDTWSKYIDPINDTPFTAYVEKKVKDLLDTASSSMKAASAIVR